MPHVKPKTDGSSTRSMRMVALSPLVHVISAAPPGRRSIVAALPNQVPSPSAVVRAAHTLAGGCSRSTVRSIRSGKPMTASAGTLQPFGCYTLYGNCMVASSPGFTIQPVAQPTYVARYIAERYSSAARTLSAASGGGVRSGGFVQAIVGDRHVRCPRRGLWDVPVAIRAGRADGRPVDGAV